MNLCLSDDVGDWGALVDSSSTLLFTHNEDFLRHSQRGKHTEFLSIVDENGPQLGIAFTASKGDIVIHPLVSFSDVLVSDSLPLLHRFDYSRILFDHLLTEYGNQIFLKKVPHPYALSEPAGFDLISQHYSVTQSTQGILMAAANDDARRIGKLRKRLRNVAIRNELQIVHVGPEEIGLSYDFLQSCLDKNRAAKPVHSKEEFQKIHEAFNENVRTYVAVKDQRTAALVTCFIYGEIVRLQYIASSREKWAQGGIDLLIESVFNNLCGFSPTYVDFGGCINPDTDEIDLGMVQFKSGFGARPFGYSTVRIERS